MTANTPAEMSAVRQSQGGEHSTAEHPTRIMKFEIYRYDPDQRPRKPYDARSSTVELYDTDKMLLDAILRIKADVDDYAERSAARAAKACAGPTR